MKRITTRAISAVALVAAMGVATPSVAFAASHKTVSSHDSSTTTVTAWTTWKATWVTYVQGLKAINTTYRTAVQTAKATYQSALASATTKAQKQTARTALQTALTAALSARVSAITAAGNPPTPPAGYNGTAYVTALQSANVTFRASVTAAQSAYVVALSTATTAAQRQAARGALETAVGNALTVRSNALIALGTPPKNPGQLS
jgi:hypothetical protein